MESAFVLRLFSAGRHVSAAVPKWNTSSSWVMTRRLDTSHAALMERQRLIGVLTLSLPVCVCFQPSAPLGFTVIFPAACSCVSTQEVDPRLYTGIWHQVWIFWSRWAVTGVRGEASTSDLITGWSCFHRTGRMSVEAHLFFLFGRVEVWGKGPAWSASMGLVFSGVESFWTDLSALGIKAGCKSSHVRQI